MKSNRSTFSLPLDEAALVHAIARRYWKQSEGSQTMSQEDIRGRLTAFHCTHARLNLKGFLDATTSDFLRNIVEIIDSWSPEYQCFFLTPSWPNDFAECEKGKALGVES